jgi:hypothetical protein
MQPLHTYTVGAIMDDKINDFDVAKALFDQLKGLDKGRQTRIVRWVAEALNLSPEVSGPSAPAAAPLAPVPSEDRRQQVGAATGATRSVDIKTFIDAKNPKNDVQFATAVAYYYRFEAPEEHRKDSIVSEDLQNATRLAGRDRFKRPHLTLNNAKNSGYLDNAGRGAFKINTVGENLVAMTLPGQQVGSQGASVGARTSRRAAAKKKR